MRVKAKPTFVIGHLSSLRSQFSAKSGSFLLSLHAVQLLLYNQMNT